MITGCFVDKWFLGITFMSSILYVKSATHCTSADGRSLRKMLAGNSLI